MDARSSKPRQVSMQGINVDQHLVVHGRPLRSNVCPAPLPGVGASVGIVVVRGNASAELWRRHRCHWGRETGCRPCCQMFFLHRAQGSPTRPVVGDGCASLLDREGPAAPARPFPWSRQQGEELEAGASEAGANRCCSAVSEQPAPWGQTPGEGMEELLAPELWAAPWGEGIQQDQIKRTVVGDAGEGLSASPKAPFQCRRCWTAIVITNASRRCSGGLPSV